MMGSGGAESEVVVTTGWCHALPKIELHAHLNGSIRDSTLLELAKDLGEKGTIVFADVEPVILKTTRTLPECFELFDLYHILATDHATVTRITKEAVEDFAAENVVYLELRTTPKCNKEKGMSKHSYVEAVIEGLKAVDSVDVAFLPNEDNSDTCVQLETMNKTRLMKRKKIYIRLLLSIDRRETTTSAIETVNLALQMKDFGVVGIDLSGNPIVGDCQTFLPALRYARSEGLPITVHCGEVPNQKEIQAILEFCPRRIGHACFLEENEWKILKSSKIPAVEICLTSNVRTCSVSSMDDHHFVELYKDKHPMALCTDDPGLFSTSLSNEYFIAASTFGLCQRELHHLAKDAVEYAFVDVEVKKKLRKIFEFP